MKRTERGVSPVISTILLIAIVVLLGTIISVFVLDVGEDVSDPAPTAAFEIEEENETIIARHLSGDSIDKEALVVRGGEVREIPETIKAGSAIEIEPETEEIVLVWEDEQDSATLTRASGLTPGGEATSLVTETNATDSVEVVEFDSDPSEEQFNELESLNLTDPFTLAVEIPELAGEESTDYAVTAFYDEFDESPKDRLAGPRTPIEFDEDGIGEVTIGSTGTDADVTTRIAPGSLSEDASLTNQIEVPEGTEEMAVEAEDDGE